MGNTANGLQHQMLHLRNTLLQQRLPTQAEALEIAMRLHETPIQDPNSRVQQIHAQLKSLSLEMQILKQDRTTYPEMCNEVWCVKCKGQGHDKDHYLVFTNFPMGGGPMPLRPNKKVGLSGVPALWCVICEIGGKHAIDNYHLLHKYMQNS